MRIIWRGLLRLVGELLSDPLQSPPFAGSRIPCLLTLLVI